jgi:hypothetical protein
MTDASSLKELMVKSGRDLSEKHNLWMHMYEREQNMVPIASGQPIHRVLGG